jgi:hypothetical protein
MQFPNELWHSYCFDSTLLQPSKYIHLQLVLQQLGYEENESKTNVPYEKSFHFQLHCLAFHQCNSSADDVVKCWADTSIAVV